MASKKSKEPKYIIENIPSKVEEVTGYKKNDIIQFKGINHSQLSYAKDGNDLIISIDGSKAVNVVNYFATKSKINTIRANNYGKTSDIKINLDANIKYTSDSVGETFNFGKGVGTITFDSTKGFGDDKVILNKGERVYLNFLNNPKLDFKISGKDVVITSDGGSVTLKGYAAKDKGATVVINGTPNLSDVYFSATTKKKNNVVGTRLNERVVSSTDDETFKLGTGNDEITFDSTKGFGDDIVVLSKGEKVDLKFADDELKYEIKGKDLIITSSKVNAGSVILKNYAGKDLGATVYIDGESIFEQQNLKNLLKFDASDFDKKGKLKTTALNDVINASKYLSTSSKGVTINSGAGDDRITGSKFNDTITASAGNNYIYENSGVNKITTGKGDDTFHLYYGYSSNTVKSTGGDNVVEIRNSGVNKITLGAGNDDISIYDGVNTINAGNSITVKEIQRIQELIGEGKLEYYSIFPQSFSVRGGINTLTSGKGFDFFEIYDGYNTINSGADHD